MDDDQAEPILSGLDEGRRSFVKKLVIAGFAAPVIATFSTSGIEAVFAQTADQSGASSPTTRAPGTTTRPPTTTTTPSGTTVPSTTTTVTTTVPPTTTTTTTTTTISLA